MVIKIILDGFSEAYKPARRYFWSYLVWSLPLIVPLTVFFYIPVFLYEALQAVFHFAFATYSVKKILPFFEVGQILWAVFLTMPIVAAVMREQILQEKRHLSVFAYFSKGYGYRYVFIMLLMLLSFYAVAFGLHVLESKYIIGSSLSQILRLLYFYGLINIMIWPILCLLYPGEKYFCRGLGIAKESCFSFLEAFFGFAIPLLLGAALVFLLQGFLSYPYDRLLSYPYNSSFPYSASFSPWKIWTMAYFWRSLLISMAFCAIAYFGSFFFVSIYRALLTSDREKQV